MSHHFRNTHPTNIPEPISSTHQASTSIPQPNIMDQPSTRKIVAIEGPVSQIIQSSLIIKRGGLEKDFYLGYDGRVIALYPLRLNLTEFPKKSELSFGMSCLGSRFSSAKGSTFLWKMKENIYISTNGMAQIGNWMVAEDGTPADDKVFRNWAEHFLKEKGTKIPAVDALKYRPLIEFKETRSQTRLQNAGVQANAKMPSWAQQPPLDLGPLPSLTGDLDKREDIPLPTTAQGKSPLVINGTEVKCEITGWKQFGLNGKQFVLQEGPLMVARFQLVAGSKITVPSILNIPKISAKPKKNKKDRDADKVAGVQEKQAAYVYGVAFKDEKNEGPKVLLTNIKANSSSVLPGMTDPPAGNSSQRSQVSSRLNHRGTYMTLRAAAKINSRHKSLTSKNLHGEQAWARRRRRTRAKTKKKKMGDADAQDEQKFRFIEQQINETQEALRKYMTERNVAKAYAKGQKLNIPVEPELLDVIVPQGWPPKK
ncbi:hypothetical protein L211DRAFT_868368 [Terfezia boudieri ATCC MYA-4762]|uniref:Uncharacterized protein n=1 Tax=Terfezia boudieri ATCC MYA-4762 TaxID=1051890 RepID=A0A3N4M0D3_9PEZI|nr:hypothetical protein L211DRAFT_868368 [Terfezia boudieri ATCC MYA-4762]